MTKHQARGNERGVCVSTLPVDSVAAQSLVGSWLSIEGAQTHCSVALQCEGEVQCHQILYASAKGHAEALPQMVDRILRFVEISPKALSGIVVCVGPGAFTGLRISVALAQGLAYAWDLPVICVPALAALSYVAAVPDSAVAHPADDVASKTTVAPVLRPSLCAFDARMGELYVGAYAFAPRIDQYHSLLDLDSKTALALDANRLTIRPAHEKTDAAHWQAWLPDSLLSPSALLAPDFLIDKFEQFGRTDGHAPAALAVVGSGEPYLKDLESLWSGSVVSVSRILSATDLIRFASEQPHLAPCVDASALAPVYLRNAVATPPARLQKS